MCVRVGVGVLVVVVGGEGLEVEREWGGRGKRRVARLWECVCGCRGGGGIERYLIHYLIGLCIVRFHV